VVYSISLAFEKSMTDRLLKLGFSGKHKAGKCRQAGLIRDNCQITEQKTISPSYCSECHVAT
jgi:hypothetical protein